MTTIRRVVAHAGDRIQVIGTVDGVTDEAGELVTIVASGYARPEEMTDDEKLAYWRQLLLDAAGSTEGPETVLYESKED